MECHAFFGKEDLRMEGLWPSQTESPIPYFVNFNGPWAGLRWLTYWFLGRREYSIWGCIGIIYLYSLLKTSKLKHVLMDFLHSAVVTLDSACIVFPTVAHPQQHRDFE